MTLTLEDCWLDPGKQVLIFFSTVVKKKLYKIYTLNLFKCTIQ